MTITEPSSRRHTAWAVAGLLVAPVIFFAPGLVRGDLLAPTDGWEYYLGTHWLGAQAWSAGVPLWNGRLFAGFPMLAQCQSAVFLPTTWLYRILSPGWACNIQIILIAQFALLGVFVLLRCLGCLAGPGFLAAVCFGLGGFQIAHMCHTNIQAVVAGYGWMLAGIELLAVRPGKWLGGLVLTGALAWMIAASHPQMLVLGLALGMAYAGWRLVGLRGRRGAFLVALGVSLLTAVCLTAPVWMSLIDYLSRTARERLTYQAFTGFSLVPVALSLFLAPFGLSISNAPGRLAAGFAVQDSLLHEQVAYVGWLPVVFGLAVVGLAAAAIPRRRFWLILVGAGILLALGGFTPLARVLYAIPGLDKFRAPARYLVFVDLGLCVLMGLALSAAIRDRVVAETIGRRALGLAGILFAALIAFFELGRWINLGSAWTDRPTTLLFQWGRPGQWTALGFSLAAVVALALRRKLPVRAWVLVLGLVAILDVGFYDLNMDWRWAVPSRSYVGRGPDWETVVRNDMQGRFGRVLVLSEVIADVNGAAARGLNLLNGYDQLRPADYWPEMAFNGVVDFQPRRDSWRLRYFGVRYLVVSQSLLMAEGLRCVPGDFHRIWADAAWAVFRSQSPAVPAAVVSCAIPCDMYQDHLDVLRSAPMDFSSGAAVRADDLPPSWRSAGNNERPGFVAAATDRPPGDGDVLDVDVARPAILALSLSFDPHWRLVLEDGRTFAPLRINYHQTGFLVPSGRYRAVLAYRPPWRTAATGLVGLGGVLPVALCAGGFLTRTFQRTQ